MPPSVSSSIRTASVLCLAVSSAILSRSPSNFIFLFIIFVLIVRMFQMSMKISQLESKLKDLVARIAIDENLRNEKKEET
ncbi:MAG: DUF2304 domain-containing protein [Lachnospiraceae bacterium]|nr:DUF2304 domain-containing protein [Lachnospiraceae bacterium]